MTLPRPKAIIFDWDDTIIENWPNMLKSLNTALVAMGREAWTDEEMRRRNGPSARDLFQSLFGERWKEADKIYYDTFLEITKKQPDIHEHVEAILKLLAQKNIYMAVVSNKRGPLLRSEAAKLGFDRYFGRIVGSGDAAADKPDPAVVQMALEGSGITPGSHVWFIGDSHTDMICASNAGCTGILIETKLPPEDALKKNPPAKRFKKHLDLMEFLNSYFT